ncbi:hypothetical protein EZV62_004979 [Acer yangbiense]|uniref:non-specific serine/threonine protein kinase n=1 Tax=Acer yangbiense TaxID=1000413 RepID=A0A5C7IMJ1_9ROSI|nr:hypothetical protein EZV62_004979 [Acer yangbiense]
MCYNELALPDQTYRQKKLAQPPIHLRKLKLNNLHRGCNIRIVHFDIKPHNVLLDEDFCPKISDFGLAKICKKKESIISMLDARGTIGYTAPEVFCRNFGGVSHKSDVYGFRMMVLEMVGARQRTVGDHESNTSEIYFPEWIYKQIEGSNDLIVDGIINEEEEVIARKMILVSLWCIQTNPSDRPAMSKALEMLEGSVQSLQVPPKPFLQHSSPRSFQLYSSTTSTSLSRIFSQGNITAVYPFWGESHQGLRPWGCTGHPELKLNCEDEGDVATMMINEVKCRVLDIKWKDKTLRNARMDYLEGICSLAFHNTTINHEILDYSDGYKNIQSSSSNPDGTYESCNIPFQCGNITAGYPFWGESPQGLRPPGCGHPELLLKCEDDEGHLATTMMIKDVKYQVLDIISKDKTLRIARMDNSEPERICSPAFHNTTINREKLDYSEGYENVTFIYYCLPPKSIPCYIEAGYDDPGNCDASVFFPIPKNSLNWKRDDESLRRVLDKGFEWKWKLRDISCENCNNSKGSCGRDPDSKETICFCPNQPNLGSTSACRPDTNLVARTIRIARKDYQNGISSPEFPKTTINFEIFDYSNGYENMTFLYDCPKPTPGLVVHFNCPSSNNVKYKDWSILAGANGLRPCNVSVVVPFPRKLNWTTIDNPSDMGKFVKEGFVLKWKFGGVPYVDCTKRKGSCGPDHSGSNVTIGVCPPSSSLPDQAPKESPSSVLHDQAPQCLQIQQVHNLN